MRRQPMLNTGHRRQEMGKGKQTKEIQRNTHDWWWVGGMQGDGGEGHT